jgi:hypothetical protein
MRTEGEARELAGLENPGFLLKPSDVEDDLGKVLPGDARNFGHVSKFPMVRSHTELRGPVKRGVRMMIGFINLVQK